MTFLAAIWWTSWFLSGIALVVMCALIVKRVWRDRRARRREKRKVQLTSIILEAVDDPKTMEGRILSGIDAEIASEVVRGLMTVVRGGAHERLKGMLKDVGAVDTYLAGLGSRDPTQRLMAVNNLAFFDEPQIKARLLEAMGTETPALRLAIACALIDMESDFPVAEVVGKLEIGVVVRSRNLRHLFRQMAVRNVQGMLGVLGETGNQVTRILIIDGLARAGDYQVVPALRRLVEDPSVDVRAAVMRGFAILDHPDASAEILRGLNDEAWEVRVQAAIGAGRIGIAEAVPRLIVLLDDARWWVRLRAAGALTRLGEAGTEALKMAAATSPQAAEVAEIALLEMADN